MLVCRNFFYAQIEKQLERGFERGFEHLNYLYINTLFKIYRYIGKIPL